MVRMLTDEVGATDAQMRHGDEHPIEPLPFFPTMSKNPIMFPHRYAQQRKDKTETAPLSLTTALLATALALGVATALPFTRHWLLSGCGVQNLVLIFGAVYNSRVLPHVPLWTILSTLNLIYAVCATSWLLRIFLTSLVYPSIFLTCLLQFDFAAALARKYLRLLLKQLTFTRDKIALFNLPAMEIDTEVDGLLVIRGLTIQLSSLTVIAHGIELGIKLTDGIELGAHCDEVTIRLFRDIHIGEVLANIKGDSELTLNDLLEDDDDADDDDSIFASTPLIRAATAGSEGFKDRPKLRESLTGVSHVRDTTAEDGFDNITTLSPDDTAIDEKYKEMLKEIRRTSAIYQSRHEARIAARAEGIDLTDTELLAAICTGMHNLPSVPHPPSRSVKVTTLQNMMKPGLRRFVNRLPFFYRLMLMMVSYFHAISFQSINVAGSGKWFKAMLQQMLFRGYTEHNMELRRLERKLSTWLSDASFCIQLADMSAQAYVPLSTDYSIVAQLKVGEIIAYRTKLETSTTAEVLRLGGADATFTLPSFLIPHHEHVLPPKPTQDEQQEVAEEAATTDDKIKAVKAEVELQRIVRDETTMAMSVHGRLPVLLDQSLLNFVAALVKATKVAEFEKDIEQDSETRSLRRATTIDLESTLSAAPSTDSLESDSLAESTSKTSKFKALSRKTLQSLADGTTKESIRGLTRDLNQATKDGFKKIAVAGMVNDRWIAKAVGKVAAKLEQAQGEFGYSSDIPIALGPYRPTEPLPSKLLP